ncbi:unnamed protein product [Bursaphelenchus okinawaensis]|uniref:Uncharacterized protein n=1 Tax=Bursaphelenchus okinawaensis TaxID=465554 RepID=A0A811L6U9_9BILA|nr:unnamed protein product [Bursaphelenchus okinawaensis]CAG9117842.1 unnamed protein product [Bursaphelenchus okinawaensis]
MLLVCVCATSSDRKVRHPRNQHMHTRPSDFVLRCPPPPKTRHKIQVSVAFYFNNKILLQIDADKIIESHRIREQTDKIQWKTLGNQSSAIISWKNDTVRFEYEEKRHWYAVRIKPNNMYELRGAWKCRLTTFVKDNRQKSNWSKFESRKFYGASKNKISVFQYAKRDENKQNNTLKTKRMEENTKKASHQVQTPDSSKISEEDFV